MSEFWVYTYIVLWLFFLYGFAGVLVDRVPGNEPLRPLPGVRTRGWYLFLYISLAVLFTLMGYRFEDQPALVIIGYLGLTAMLITVSVMRWL